MKKIVTIPIQLYQKHISPLTPPSCRYYPTCSTYALQAVEKHGALKGGMMGLVRVLRCNPFVEGGVDEVPDYFTLRRNPANINDLYIPGQNILRDNEIKDKVATLLEVYKDQLNIFEKLPNPVSILQQITKIKELDVEAIEQEFSKEELEYLTDIEIIPEFPSEHFRYFTLERIVETAHFTKDIESFDEGIILGKDFPLIVLENTGIWYTNLPKIQQEFLITRGVTPEDIESKSYHLWMVLRALEEKIKNKQQTTLLDKES